MVFDCGLDLIDLKKAPKSSIAKSQISDVFSDL